MRILIVDDEDLARLRLRSLLADLAQAGVAPPSGWQVEEAGSAAEALHLLARAPADVLLLDIHMPGQDGLALARRLKADGPAGPAVVFVTAHAEHALSAFELDAVDYLTKPVRRARLQEALQRVQARRLAQGRPLGAGEGPGAAPALVPASGPAAEATLVVSDRGRVLRIPVAEVVYLKAEMKYVTLCTVNHRYVLDDALADLEQRLGSAGLRIHRNAVVARDAVRALEKRAPNAAEGEEAAEGWAVQVAPSGEWLAVSRRQLASVRELLGVGG